MQERVTRGTGLQRQAPVASISELPLPERRAPEIWPFFDEDEIAAVSLVLRSGRVNQWTGAQVRAFEQALATFCNVEHAVAVTNGSVALELALMGIAKKFDYAR